MKCTRRQRQEGGVFSQQSSDGVDQEEASENHVLEAAEVGGLDLPSGDVGGGMRELLENEHHDDEEEDPKLEGLGEAVAARREPCAALEIDW